MRRTPPPDERDQALRLLRDLGTVLSFPDDGLLSGLGVVNPNWVTRAIYPLLTSKEVAATGGLLDLDDLNKLLPDKQGYPPHDHRWLVELMKKFELLFENEGRLLIPARLPKDIPEWAMAADWKDAEFVQLELRFGVLPESVISKFITRWHSRAWKPGSWWRHGIAVKHDRGDCVALVRAFIGDPGRIELSVKGSKVARQQFIAMLRAELESLTANLGGVLWLVLEGVHAEKYDDLLVLVHEGKERTIKRVVDGKVREFDLVKALDLVEDQTQQQQALVNITNVGRDAVGNAFGPNSTAKN